jgi:hypothetical protein
MAPKAKASAPAHLVITGKVRISQDGSAIVVKKTLGDGATVEEKFPKRRVKGKQRQLQQLIPAEDVLRTIEEATDIVAEAVRGDGEKRVQAISSVANKLSDVGFRAFFAIWVVSRVSWRSARVARAGAAGFRRFSRTSGFLGPRGPCRVDRRGYCALFRRS